MLIESCAPLSFVSVSPDNVPAYDIGQDLAQYLVDIRRQNSIDVKQVKEILADDSSRAGHVGWIA